MGALGALRATGRWAQRIAPLRSMLFPSRKPGAQREGTAHPEWVRNSATVSGRAAVCQRPECQGLVAAGGGNLPPAPGDLAVPDATAGKCVRHLRKSLLYFHKIIITAACYGPLPIRVISASGAPGGPVGLVGKDRNEAKTLTVPSASHPVS